MSKPFSWRSLRFFGRSQTTPQPALSASSYTYTQVVVDKNGEPLDPPRHGLNRDAVRVALIGSQVGVIAVADGCGLTYWSEIAANIAVNEFIVHFEKKLASETAPYAVEAMKSWVRAAIHSVNQAMLTWKHPKLKSKCNVLDKGGNTTLVVAIVFPFKEEQEAPSENPRRKSEALQPAHGISSASSSSSDITPIPAVKPLESSVEVPHKRKNSLLGSRSAEVERKFGVVFTGMGDSELYLFKVNEPEKPAKPTKGTSQAFSSSPSSSSSLHPSDSRSDDRPSKSPERSSPIMTGANESGSSPATVHFSWTETPPQDSPMRHVATSSFSSALTDHDSPTRPKHHHHHHHKSKDKHGHKTSLSRSSPGSSPSLHRIRHIAQDSDSKDITEGQTSTSEQTETTALDPEQNETQTQLAQSDSLWKGATPSSETTSGDPAASDASQNGTAQTELPTVSPPNPTDGPNEASSSPAPVNIPEPDEHLTMSTIKETTEDESTRSPSPSTSDPPAEPEHSPEIVEVDKTITGESSLGGDARKRQRRGGDVSGVDHQTPPALESSALPTTQEASNVRSNRLSKSFSDMPSMSAMLEQMAPLNRSESLKLDLSSTQQITTGEMEESGTSTPRIPCGAWARILTDSGKSPFLPFPGMKDRAIPDPQFIALNPGDAVFACSDGVASSYPEGAIVWPEIHAEEYECSEGLNNATAALLHSTMHHHTASSTDPDDVTIGAIKVTTYAKRKKTDSIRVAPIRDHTHIFAPQFSAGQYAQRDYLADFLCEYPKPKDKNPS